MVYSCPTWDMVTTVCYIQGHKGSGVLQGVLTTRLQGHKGRGVLHHSGHHTGRTDYTPYVMDSVLQCMGKDRTRKNKTKIQ